MNVNCSANYRNRICPLFCNHDYRKTEFQQSIKNSLESKKQTKQKKKKTFDTLFAVAVCLPSLLSFTLWTIAFMFPHFIHTDISFSVSFFQYLPACSELVEFPVTQLLLLNVRDANLHQIFPQTACAIRRDKPFLFVYW